MNVKRELSSQYTGNSLSICTNCIKLLRRHIVVLEAHDDKIGGNCDHPQWASDTDYIAE